VVNYLTIVRSVLACFKKFYFHYLGHFGPLVQYCPVKCFAGFWPYFVWSLLVALFTLLVLKGCQEGF